ncbi:hypothetical protein R1sor_026302 [Riccia sorocarpa]|uniref:Uncharacterized protein n=1 Tax=Riccia sorocarpa TaxID=122646 RepID=A0ABD3GGN3_9MARC
MDHKTDTLNDRILRGFETAKHKVLGRHGGQRDLLMSPSTRNSAERTLPASGDGNDQETVQDVSQEKETGDRFRAPINAPEGATKEDFPPLLHNDDCGSGNFGFNLARNPKKGLKFEAQRGADPQTSNPYGKLVHLEEEAMEEAEIHVGDTDVTNSQWAQVSQGLEAILKDTTEGNPTTPMKPAAHQPTQVEEDEIGGQRTPDSGRAQLKKTRENWADVMDEDLLARQRNPKIKPP